ncbi:MAG: NYN domain-containing protein [Clostridiaceae bacterium]
MVDEKRFAVLIDADNVSAKYIKYILDEISSYGVATYKRIYGDWTTPNTASWKDILLENSVTPVQQYGYTVGKNATDSAMIIDAMDILYSKNVEGFCIVSSDSDFTKLSSRLRESGMLVVGMGEKKTPKPFIAACNQFKYLDVLLASDEKTIELNNENGVKVETKPVVGEKKDLTATLPSGNGKKPVKLEKTEDAKTMTDIEVIKAAVIKMMNEVEAQSMNMGEIGNRLVKRYPDFDVRNYGDTKLSKFLKKFGFLEFNTKGKDGTSMWVSLKDEGIEIPEEPAVVAQPGKKRSYRRYKTKK